MTSIPIIHDPTDNLLPPGTTPPPRVIVVAGPPGSGKGTLCKALARAPGGFAHVSTGDLFRDAIARDTPLGRVARAHIERGDFVPDDLTLQLVRDRLGAPDVAAAAGVLLDGFPRTAPQARALRASGLRVERLLLLACADDACAERVSGRRVDPATGDIYHLRHAPPPAGAVAARCAAREGFEGDAQTLARLRTYHAQLGLVLPCFRGLIQVLSAAPAPDAVAAAARAMLDAPAPTPPEDAAPQHAAAAEPAAPPARCVVCLDAPADHLCAPCGHQCGCGSCLSAVRASGGGRCPICRARIDSLVRVFASGSEAPGAATAPVAAATVVVAPPAEDDGGWGEDAPDDDDDDAADADGGWGSAPLPVTLEIAPADEINLYSFALRPEAAAVPVCVRVVAAPDGGVARAPVDVCCVIDTSGSMCSLAKFDDPDAAAGAPQRDDGLAILDVVKHAVRAVIHTLGDDDRLALVAFDSTATTALPLARMTAEGKARATAALGALRPKAQTNLWEGLLRGLEELRADDDRRGGEFGGAAARPASVLLLTDGMPTVSPPQGDVGAFEAYLEAHPALEKRFQLHTFGFGYGLDSKLLLELAATGRGAFSFIPDAKIVGTVFVNCVANALSCATQRATLHLAPKGGAAFAGACGGQPSARVEDASWGRVVPLGALALGQARDVIVPLRALPDGDAPYLEATVTFDGAGETRRVRALGVARAPTADARAAAARADAVGALVGAIADADASRGQRANRALAELAGRLEAATADAARGADARVAALAEDVRGRALKALSTKERFARWGRHYLRALARAHELQLCTNFMDPGLQPYGGGALFRELRDKGGQVFVELPPPTSSRGAGAVVRRAASPPRAAGGAARRVAPAPAPTRPAAPDMREYYAGSGGGCFAPHATVEVADDESGGAPRRARVADVRAGDRVRVADGGFAAVACVAQIERDAAAGAELVLLPGGGPALTPGHPVRVGGVWRAARDVAGARPVATTPHVYNFVLERAHVVLVDGVEAATWAHGLEDAGVAHAFYGTRAVLDALRRLDGWRDGRVRVRGALRDKRTDEVVGLLGDDAAAAEPALEHMATPTAAAAS